ncbi:sigma-70 family RNA polymerase sigma factor [Salinivibrio kushneri]|uniref:sigma-70 family RNA polymerase sigma factor n=1 Tax=Salinivibrio kushneri TaxID=1908198 RepID=UPI0010546725|nr:sigma-70 family RNA polymerase sigma factor [Salinivibrio kushneri]
MSLIIALRRSLLQYCQNAYLPEGDETLRQSISRLRAHDREVIALAYLFQLPFCDIAMICSQPEDSARQRLCVIRQHLQTTLSDRILSPSGID